MRAERKSHWKETLPSIARQNKSLHRDVSYPYSTYSPERSVEGEENKVDIDEQIRKHKEKMIFLEHEK